MLCAAIAFQQREAIEEHEKENDLFSGVWQNSNTSSNFGSIDEADLLTRPAKKKFKRSEPTITDLDDKVRSLLAMVESDDEPESGKLKQRKIYFCSRTHSQLSQVMGELKKIVSRAVKIELLEDYSAVTLGSRANLCINPDVIKLRSVQRINDKCLELQGGEKDKCCPYYNQDKEPNMKILEESMKRALVADIEEAHRLGEKIGACPYYGTRRLQEDVQLVTIPYNVLLQKESRDAFGIDFNGAIVIIDEAHNLIDAINSIYSLTIEAVSIESALRALSSYFDKYSKRLSPSNAIYIQQLQNGLSLINKFADQVTKSEVLGINEFLHQVGIDNLNVFPIQHYLQESRLSQKISGFYPEAGDPNRLNEIVRFLVLLGNSDCNGRVSILNENGVVKLRYVSLNPETYFKEIVEQAHSIILAGGTMSPSSDFIDMLFEPGPVRERIVQFNCGHLIPKENCIAVILSSGPTGIPLELSYANRLEPSVVAELGQTLINLATITPDGVVCFFPSYSYMEDLIDAWSTSKVMETLKARKHHVVVENQNSDAETLMESYKQAIGKHKNAILFGVMGGRLSEGINFADNLARLVVVIGMPFPNAQDPETAARLEYFVKRQAKLAPSMDQTKIKSDYLENLCMRSVNQTLGMI